MYRQRWLKWGIDRDFPLKITVLSVLIAVPDQILILFYSTSLRFFDSDCLAILSHILLDSFAISQDFWSIHLLCRGSVYSTGVRDLLWSSSGDWRNRSCIVFRQSYFDRSMLLAHASFSLGNISQVTLIWSIRRPFPERCFWPVMCESPNQYIGTLGSSE